MIFYNPYSLISTLERPLAQEPTPAKQPNANRWLLAAGVAALLMTGVAVFTAKRTRLM